MNQFFLELTVRSVLIASAAGAIIVIIRVRSAAARHALWTATMLAMLLLPVWVVCGPKVRVEVLPDNEPDNEQRPIGAPAPSAVISTFSHRPEVTRIIPIRPNWPWRNVAAGIYLFGLGVLLLRLALGTWRGLALMRTSEPNTGFRASSRCVSPVTVGFLRPAVILPATWREWPAWKLDVVLTHEKVHATRRDPLVQWLALLNRAAFWFHPLAWWLERQLSTLAEQACDDAVLERGHDPHDYAQCLLALARSVAHAGVRVNAWGMPMPGSELSRRIHRILDSSRAPRISRARVRGAVMSFAVASLVLAAGTPERVPPIPQLAPPSMPRPTGSPIQEMTIAQVQPAPHPIPLAAPTSASKRAFLSASITLASPGDPRGSTALTIQPGGKLELRGAWLPGIIMRAYGAKGINFLAYGIRGPRPDAGQKDWCLTDHYDVVAQGPPGASEADAQTMLQALLQDHFKLKAHIKDETFPSYDLVVAEGGPKLQPSHDVGTKGCHSVDAGENSYRECRNLTMRAFTSEFASAGVVGEVVDATGLAGAYDFSLPLRPALPGVDPPDVVAVARTAAFQAVAQLGLKLVLHPRPMPMIFVDHIEPLGWVD